MLTANTTPRFKVITNDAENAYESMCECHATGIGREILITCGLTEWLSCFNNARSMEKPWQHYIQANNRMSETRDEIVILFANILQRVI